MSQMDSHSSEMRQLLQAQSFVKDLTIHVVYGSLNQIENVWMQHAIPGSICFYVNGRNPAYRTYVTTPDLLTQKQLEHYDLMLISVPSHIADLFECTTLECERSNITLSNNLPIPPKNPALQLLVALIEEHLTTAIQEEVQS